MLDFLVLPSLSAGARVLVEDVLGPLTKAAAEDFYKDFLKQSVSEAIAIHSLVRLTTVGHSLVLLRAQN